MARFARHARKLAAAATFVAAAPGAGVEPLPKRLSATGLFVPGSTRLAAGVLAFSPQYPLWSDGTRKRRWIQLPPGASIDASRVDAWEFPVGTKVWKEFGYGRAIETRMIEPGICYIRISNFGGKSAEEFQKAFDGLDLAGLEGIILDIRHNPGGDSDQAYAVIGCLTDRPLQGSKWKSLCYVPAYRSWGQPTGWKEEGPAVIEPRAGKRYNGPLTVLTGPGTFSAAEDFLVPLQYARRAVLVGEKTAGSTGNPIRVPLPGGGTFMVVSKRDTFPDGREFVGIGIPPDVEIHPTRQDLLEGTDSVLGKAVDVIKNWGFYHKQ